MSNKTQPPTIYPNVHKPEILMLRLPTLVDLPILPQQGSIWQAEKSPPKQMHLGCRYLVIAYFSRTERISATIYSEGQGNTYPAADPTSLGERGQGLLTLQVAELKGALYHGVACRRLLSPLP